MAKIEFKFTNVESKTPEKEKVEEKKIEKQEEKIKEKQIEKKEEPKPIVKSINVSEKPAPNIQQKNSEEELETWYREVRKNARYDPLWEHPDFQNDHYIWKQVLQVAEKQDKKIYGLLHFIRCMGGRLKLDRDKNGWPILKLNIEESKWLLEEYEPELHAFENPEYEQMKLINTPETISRKENIERAKAREELEKKAREKVLREMVIPHMIGVKMVFDLLRPLLKKAESLYGTYTFNLDNFNEYLERRERGLA